MDADRSRPRLRRFAAAAIASLGCAAALVPDGRAVVAAETSPSAPAKTSSAATELTALLARRGSKPFVARFRQTKHVALLREPLVSTGRMSFEPPERVRWEVEAPEPFVVEADGAKLRAGPPGKLADVSEMASFGTPGALTGLFTGVPEDLAGSFDVTSSGAGRFRLVPRDPALLRILVAIDLDLDPETGVPRRVVLNEAGGDRAEIEISREGATAPAPG